MSDIVGKKRKQDKTSIENSKKRVMPPRDAPLPPAMPPAPPPPSAPPLSTATLVNPKLYFENGEQYLPYLFEFLNTFVIGPKMDFKFFQQKLLTVFKTHDCREGEMFENYLDKTIDAIYCNFIRNIPCIHNIYVIHLEPDAKTPLQLKTSDNVSSRSSGIPIRQYIESNIKAFLIYDGQPIIKNANALYNTIFPQTIILTTQQTIQINGQHILPEQIMEIKLLCSADRMGSSILKKFMSRMVTKGIKLFILEEADKLRDSDAKLIKFYQRNGFMGPNIPNTFTNWLHLDPVDTYDPYDRYMFYLHTDNVDYNTGFTGSIEDNVRNRYEIIHA